MIDVLDGRVQRRGERREFFKAALGAAAVGAGLAYAGAASAQTTVTDADVLNFALNLEYLEANFYYFAVNGTAIPDASTGGTGNRGAATGGRKVTFTDPVIAAYAKEIAQDELAHVNFLRTALGGSAVAQPAIDVSASSTGAFSAAARAAGLIGAGQAFDPYAGDLNFLYAAFLFEDVGVTAYKGASPLLTNKTYLDAAAGILAAEAYHASIVRTSLDRMGAMPGLKASTVRGDTELVSNARDSLDGSSDLDQGIAQINATSGTVQGTLSNIAPTDANGIAFSRSTGQVLNIVYLTNAQANKGGFFPNGVNGAIVNSANNA